MPEKDVDSSSIYGPNERIIELHELKYREVSVFWLFGRIS
jgi:hypothetical protein